MSKELVKITQEQFYNIKNGLYESYYKLMKLSIVQPVTIKELEIGFQDVIEKIISDNCWWKVTDIQIFNHLAEFKDPQKTINAILYSLNVEETSAANVEIPTLEEIENILQKGVKEGLFEEPEPGKYRLTQEGKKMAENAKMRKGDRYEK